MISHLSDMQGDKTLCGRNIYPSTVVDRFVLGAMTCDACAEIESTREQRRERDRRRVAK